MADAPAPTTGERFERVDLSGALFREVDLTGAEFRDADLTGARLRGVLLCDAEVEGDISGLTINGVLVAPLVEAELDRRWPERVKMRPQDAAGFREAWDVLERLWRETEERARELDPAQLHASVDGEWSFVETLRHLVMATDAWVGRALLGDPSPWHPLGIPCAGLPDIPALRPDEHPRPTLDEVLEVRHGRMATVRGVVDALTDEGLDGVTEPVDGPGWPPPRNFRVRECLGVLLSEEWEHRRIAERDLAVLRARSAH